MSCVSRAVGLASYCPSLNLGRKLVCSARCFSSKCTRAVSRRTSISRSSSRLSGVLGAACGVGALKGGRPAPGPGFRGGPGAGELFDAAFKRSVGDGRRQSRRHTSKQMEMPAPITIASMNAGRSGFSIGGLHQGKGIERIVFDASQT